MGILSWWKGGGNNTTTTTTTTTKQIQPVSEPNPDPKPNSISSGVEEVAGMNGAVEVQRPSPEMEAIVFEFGSVKSSTDKVTLIGYCPVSDELEPCRWEILPATSSDDPQFRVVF